MPAELPSQEDIIAVLTRAPLASAQLRGEFNVTKKHKLAFKAILADMVETGILGRNALKQYVVGKHKEGDKPDAPVYDGRPASRRRKQELEEDSLERVHKGTLIQEEEQWLVRDSSSQKTFRVANRKGRPGKVGELVIFEIYPHPKHRFEMLAKIVASMDSYGTFSDLKAMFHENFDLPPSFSPEIENEIKPMQEPSEKDFAGRVDYRNTRILCIDPLGARDHDDAVSVEHLPKGGYRLGVHIADVSFYVKEGGHLDNEAVERSYTQYLPWCAVPMLPEKLSAELCSLNEKVDRLAFTCMMVLDEKARVQSFEFHRSVINVTRSITYEQAMELYEKNDDEVHNLAEVARLLKTERRKSGLLELNSPEYKVDFDDKGEPVGISARSSVESNSWIEECMLIANKCCAQELVKRGLQGIFRIHEAPDVGDIFELATAEPELVRESPIKIKDLQNTRAGESNLHPEIFALYQHMVEKAAGIDPKLFKILRSMQKAHYDSNAFGHFALNWQDYAHFTSPIRRYADLWCHRELARTGKDIKAKREHDIVEVCELISANEIKNQKCERAALKVCTAWMLRDKVGENFLGTINGMEEWGIFITLDSPPADGLARFRDLPGDDFWFFNRERGCIVGRRSRKSFYRGDRVEVQLLRVNPQKGEIDLAVLAKLESAKPAKKDESGEGEGDASPRRSERRPESKGQDGSWGGERKPRVDPRMAARQAGQPEQRDARPEGEERVPWGALGTRKKGAPLARGRDIGPSKGRDEGPGRGRGDGPARGRGPGPKKTGGFKPPKTAGKPKRRK